MIRTPSRSTTGRGLAKYRSGIGMSSRWMYFQTSSSVQFDSGKTRIDWPGASCVFAVRQNSGRCLRGSHW